MRSVPATSCTDRRRQGQRLHSPGLASHSCAEVCRYLVKGTRVKRLILTLKDHLCVNTDTGAAILYSILLLRGLIIRYQFLHAWKRLRGAGRKARQMKHKSRDANWTLYSLSHCLPPHLQDKWPISLPVQERSGSGARRGAGP